MGGRAAAPLSICRDGPCARLCVDGAIRIGDDGAIRIGDDGAIRIGDGRTARLYGFLHPRRVFHSALLPAVEQPGHGVDAAHMGGHLPLLEAGVVRLHVGQRLALGHPFLAEEEEQQVDVVVAVALAELRPAVRHDALHHLDVALLVPLHLARAANQQRPVGLLHLFAFFVRGHLVPQHLRFHHGEELRVGVEVGRGVVREEGEVGDVLGALVVGAFREAAVVLVHLLPGVVVVERVLAFHIHDDAQPVSTGRDVAQEGVRVTVHAADHLRQFGLVLHLVEVHLGLACGVAEELVAAAALMDGAGGNGRQAFLGLLVGLAAFAVFAISLADFLTQGVEALPVANQLHQRWPRHGDGLCVHG